MSTTEIAEYSTDQYPVFTRHALAATETVWAAMEGEPGARRLSAWEARQCQTHMELCGIDFEEGAFTEIIWLHHQGRRIGAIETAMGPAGCKCQRYTGVWWNLKTEWRPNVDFFYS